MNDITCLSDLRMNIETICGAIAAIAFDKPVLLEGLPGDGAVSLARRLARFVPRAEDVMFSTPDCELSTAEVKRLVDEFKTPGLLFLNGANSFRQGVLHSLVETMRVKRTLSFVGFDTATNLDEFLSGPIGDRVNFQRIEMDSGAPKVAFPLSTEEVLDFVRIQKKVIGCDREFLYKSLMRLCVTRMDIELSRS